MAIQTTIEEILVGKYDQVGMEGIYVFRDGEHILYVGRSIDVVQRIYDHIQKWTSSSVGNIIYANHPRSLSWQIDLMEVEECRDIVKSRYARYQESDIPIDIETAELCMIYHYHPCVNTSNNPEPTKLPAHIKRWAVRLEAGATDDLF